MFARSSNYLQLSPKKLLKRLFYQGIVLLLLGILTMPLSARDDKAFTLESPKVVLTDLNFSLKIIPSTALYVNQDSSTLAYSVADGSGKILAEGTYQVNALSPAAIDVEKLQVSASGAHALNVTFGEASENVNIRAIPGFLSLLPPLIAIILALITRQVIIALFCGIWLGATIVFGYNPLIGFLRTLDHYVINALADAEHVYILVFSLALGGMVGVISRSGGTQGIVEKLSRYAKSPRGGQLSTWAMGVFIFFDDYANTLIVGNTMRPLTDKLKISREKLSYLVDSTASPVANIAIISTWIGYEISLISQSFQTLGVDKNAYLTFIETIPYNFYPVYTLFFGFMIAFLMRDFGAMRRAEERARATGQVLRNDAMPLADLADPEMIADESIPKRWYNAVVPVGVVIVVVMIGLYYTGLESLKADGSDVSGYSWIQYLSSVIGSADSFSVLVWASIIGSIVAIGMAVGQKLLNLDTALRAWVGGVRAMVMAILILTTAWAIGDICKDLSTADYVVQLTKTFLTPEWLPLLIFLGAAVISFSTGTAWGTMAILMPIAIPLAYSFPIEAGLSESHAMSLLLSGTAAVLAGAIFGDHCSPISDTTIMSSMASGADHIDHVRTQLPYALTCAGVASALGYIPVGFGISNWLVLPLGLIAIVLILFVFGKKSE